MGPATLGAVARVSKYNTDMDEVASVDSSLNEFVGSEISKIDPHRLHATLDRAITITYPRLFPALVRAAQPSRGVPASEPESVAHDVLVLFAERLVVRSFREKILKKPVSYLRTIARRRAVKAAKIHAERTRRHRRLVQGSVQAARAPDFAYERKALLSIILSCDLTPFERLLLRARVWLDLSNSTIVNILGMKRDTIAHAIGDALQRLRDCVASRDDVSRGGAG